MSVPARLEPRYPIDVLRQHIAPDATDLELVFFGQVCARLDLDPFADQIVFIGRNDRRAGGKVHRHQITVAGRRALAERQPEWAGSDGPMWCGPRAHEDAPLVWREVWDGENHPYAARTLVYRHDWIKPANGTVKWDEFAQYDSNGNLIPTWKQMPSFMLGKVSESLALRRAFSAIDTAIAIAGGDQPISPEEEAALDVAAEISMDAAPELPAPSITDQVEAHRIIGALDAEARDRFLADWRLDDFGARWPADAVADALGRRE